MGTNKKVRSDALLKNLPAERQEQIIEWCDKPNDREDGEPRPGTGGFPFAREQLAADGVRVSLRALSDFWSWWHLQRDMDAVFDIQEMVATRTGDPALARSTAETVFLNLSVAKQDAKVFAAATKAADSRRALDMDREKFQFDAAKAVLAKLAELKTIARDRALSEDDKITQVRLRLWGPDPKLLEGPQA